MTTNGKLYSDVMDKLHFEPNIDDTNITISIKDNGVVVLGGFVKSYTEKRLAEEAVEKLQGVHGVANELSVDLASSYKRNDTDIAQAALNALRWTMFVPHEQIKVAIENGYLTLTGEVQHNYEKQAAERAVRNLYGVIYVTNNIKIKPAVKPQEVKNKIVSEFQRNARIDANNIDVEVEGNRVILSGRVKNLDESREARNAAWAVPGVGSVEDRLSISW